MNNHPRIEYRKRIVSLHKIIKGSVLQYESTNDSGWKDLVLRKNGKVIARMMTYGTFGNNDLRFY